MKTEYGWFWHIHHEILLEMASEPIANRISYIKTDKAKTEVALRLRLLKPVKGLLPLDIIGAYNKYKRTGTSVDEAAFAKLVETSPKLAALHAKECPNCTWNGRTILTKPLY